MARPSPKRFVLLAITVLLAACGGSGDSASNVSGRFGSGVTPTQPQNLDRSCDDAAYPSADWTQCELSNFAKTGEAITEQLSPGFIQRWQEQSFTNIQEWIARALADPSWLSPPSGNTFLTPSCATWGEPCVGDPFRYADFDGPDGKVFYEDEAEVTPVVFYDRDCARLSGHVWLPKNAAGIKLPNIVFVNGSIQAPEPVYWHFIQPLVRAGYVVLTYDPRGQGRSDQQTPTLQQGSNLGPHVFWDNQVDAIDFFRSTPGKPYPHNQTCAGTYPTPVTPYNPIWNSMDLARLGIIGHSLGAMGVSVVQGYGAPGADPWPGQMDNANPVKVAVAFDSLVNLNSEGLTPVTNCQLPIELENALAALVIAQGSLPKFGPRVPALSFSADYCGVPVTYLSPPDLEAHKLIFAEWQAAHVPAFTITFQGTTHFDYSPLPLFPATSWCPDTAQGACRGGWGVPAIVHYTVAWFDRWLKKSGEQGYGDADQRLVDDGGLQGAIKMSFHYRSARDFPDRSGKRQVCEDIRAGC